MLKGSVATLPGQALRKLPAKLPQHVFDLIDLDGTRLKSPESRSDTAGASIFTVHQEKFCLKLQPAKGVVKALVVDHLEKALEN
jgi:uncharacterized protein (TIGR03435 family)